MEPSASLICKAAGNVVVRMWRRWIVVVEMKSRVAPESISTRSCLLYRVRTVMTRSSEWEVVGGKGGVGVVVADRGDEVGDDSGWGVVKVRWCWGGGFGE